MKTLYVLLFMGTSLICSSQSKVNKQPQLTSPLKETTLNEKNFKSVGGETSSVLKNILILYGDDSIGKSNFDFNAPEKEFKSFTVDRINAIIWRTNERLALQMVNKNTYIPKLVSVYFSEGSKTWVCSISYSAKANSGITKDGSTSFIYDSKGEFIEVSKF